MPTMMTTQFGFSAVIQPGSSLSIAHAGISSMKSIGIAEKMIGTFRRHKKKVMTRKASPARSWLVAPKSGQRIIPPFPAALKDQVTTPAGCTIAGILTMEDGRIRSVLARTVQEAAKVASGLG